MNAKILLENGFNLIEEYKYNDKTKIKDAIMLLRMSYAKAAASFPETQENQELLENLVVQWGTILGTVVKKMV